MRPDPGQRYYTAYDKRYRCVYEQGVPYWTAFPEELRSVEAQVDTFLHQFGLLGQEETSVVELGCGEGYVGEILAKRGLRYTGVDVAPSAAAKARERLAPFGDRARVVVGDMLDTALLAPGSFDAAVDVQCLHMLVVDADRRTYLANAWRVLKVGAPMLLCHQRHREDAPADVVESYEHWLAASGEDVDTPEPRAAWRDGGEVTIRLPRIASRPRSIEQYRAEIVAAGFDWVRAEIGADRREVCFHAVRR